MLDLKPRGRRRIARGFSTEGLLGSWETEKGVIPSPRPDEAMVAEVAVACAPWSVRSSGA
eukprot:12644579-Alexandrium_andersonii.AAC.1